MRQLGTLDSQSAANKFRDYLLSQNVESKVDQVENTWEIWIVNEDDLPKAKSEFEAFQQNPDADHFSKGAQLASSLRAEQEKQAVEEIRQRMKIRRQMQPPQLTTASVTSLLIIGSVIVTLLTLMKQNDLGSISVTDFTICEYRNVSPDVISWAPGFREIREGEIWRLFTPVFIHFDPFHLLFNMYWLFLFGAMLEPRLKSWRFLIMVLTIGILSNIGEYYFRIPLLEWRPDPSFGGMSGVNYGLFGYIWVKGSLEPEAGIALPQFTIYLMIGFFFICMTGMIGPIANGAHTFGLLIGCAIAGSGTLIKRGLKP
ncbi:rhomboid family intramembrane serine protease [uncultured Rubinisphaera sp.]|uniref:rhomboid family intramembrane serine protease n=1 Tax=uncultured Rubinisphaera sp. TaxID=1678686 RepID=UPI000EF0E8DD|nr:hypothetical protein [Planctomycetaceae bacterium]|tara:strand:+ start:248 stop:1189 length:942 start_codon:yes stop_codon:yes gene_type:complete